MRRKTVSLKSIFVSSKQKNEEQVIPNKSDVPNVEYTSMDACICCGRYMAEGTGLVCPECQKKYGLDENNRH